MSLLVYYVIYVICISNVYYVIYVIYISFAVKRLVINLH